MLQSRLMDFNFYLTETGSLSVNDTVLCFGEGDELGQLQVPAGSEVDDSSGYRVIAAGENQTCYVTGDGRLGCIGSGTPQPGAASAISLRGHHGCAALWAKCPRKTGPSGSTFFHATSSELCTQATAGKAIATLSHVYDATECCAACVGDPQCTGELQRCSVDVSVWGTGGRGCTEQGCCYPLDGGSGWPG